MKKSFLFSYTIHHSNQQCRCGEDGIIRKNIITHTYLNLLPWILTLFPPNKSADYLLINFTKIECIDFMNSFLKYGEITYLEKVIIHVKIVVTVVPIAFSKVNHPLVGPVNIKKEKNNSFWYFIWSI